MSKTIRLCLFFSIISLHLSLPSLAMDNDQEIINRITRKIAKYEIKISDLRILLENFQIKEENQKSKPSPSPREININPRGQTTPLHTNQKISHQATPQEITQDQIRNYIREMNNDGSTYAEIGVLLGYLPDKSIDTPNGNSTGKAAVKKFLEGQNSPSFCEKFKEKVRIGDINFPPLVARSPEREGRIDAPTQRQPATPITPIISNKTKKQYINSQKKKEESEAEKKAKKKTIQSNLQKIIIPTTTPIEQPKRQPAIPIIQTVHANTTIQPHQIFPSGEGAYEMIIDPYTGETGWISREEEEEEDRREERRNNGWDSSDDD